MSDSDEDQRTVWCGNLSNRVTEEILYELFLQAAPLQKVRIPKDKDGNQTSYGFVTFKHVVSVPYAIELLNGTALYNKRINIKPRNNNFHRQNSQPENPVMLNHLPNHLAFNTLDALQGVNLLMEMGNNLIDNRVNGNSPVKNFVHRHQHGGHPYYRDDRREDSRSYRRNNSHRDNDDRYNRSSYSQNRRHNRRM